jgi:hypothetical protein
MLGTVMRRLAAEQRGVSDNSKGGGLARGIAFCHWLHNEVRRCHGSRRWKC